MLKTVKDFILKNNINIDLPVICAVSGGADSVCLLHILYDLGYEVILAHVNHHKRKESEIEAIKMKELANKLNIPFELLDYHYDGVDNFHNDSHNARYDFFRMISKKYHTNIIATAHHSDDQIETVLMKILEGSNLYGYGGIAVESFDGYYKTIRPLLCVSKEEIYNYAKQNNYEYFEDSSNQEDIFLRNRIRHHIVPLLKKECNDLNKKIIEYSIQAHEAFDFIRKNSIDYLNNNHNKIEYNSFKVLDIALKKDIISLLLEKNNIRKNNNIILQLLSLLDNNNGYKEFSLESDYLFIRAYDYAYIDKRKCNQENSIKINIDDIGIFCNKYKFYFSKNKPINNAKYIKLCYNNLELPLKIRNRISGDYIEALAGTKKISRVLIDNKVPLNERDNVPIILDNSGKILWIYDYIKSKDVYNQKHNGDLYLICEVIYE